VVYDSPGIRSLEDPILKRMDDFTLAVENACSSPRSFLVEFLPWMKYAPSSLTNWKKDAEEHFKGSSRMFESLYNEVRDRIVSKFIEYHRHLHGSHFSEARG
jgi:hypothetical protein